MIGLSSQASLQRGFSEAFAAAFPYTGVALRILRD